MTTKYYSGLRHMDIANYHEDVNSNLIYTCINIPYELWPLWMRLIAHLDDVYQRYSEYFDIDYQEYINLALELIVNNEQSYRINSTEDSGGLIDLLEFEEHQQDRVEALLDDNLMYIENDFYEYYVDYFHTLLTKTRDVDDSVYEDYNEAQMMVELIDPMYLHRDSTEMDIIDFILESVRDIPGTYQFIANANSLRVEDDISFSLNMINIVKVDVKRGNIAVHINQKSNTI